MFKHIFATMQDILQDIIIHYPKANDNDRKALDDQLIKLKQFSDMFIEEWLQFEEKMADFRELQQQCLHGGSMHACSAPPPVPGYPKTISEVPAESASKTPASYSTSKPEVTYEMDSISDAELRQAMSQGQGYFKLLMFREAAGHFQQAIAISPDFNHARLFLGMSYMHLQEWHEAQRHFQLLVEVTEHPKWRALGLNALGCIQAVRMNLEQAAIYFEKAHEADPNFTDPLSNMKSCQEHEGHLSLYFGSGQL
ncbi:hypothetical protein [Paenibacillus sp. R14(2021)]|uniref:hypothetical protein n=1 Tax=Paenibacillus sp. R14(2021) TaxID=2859228 RepID=UPI001C61472D|nr:hypothetical protein [Paenibacillus sp. R14(2021)]